MFRRLLLAAPLLAIVGCAQTRPGPAPAAVNTVVFFTPDSAALDPAARDAVAKAADAAKQRADATVHVRGFAAPDAGSAQFNNSLSRTRAEAVADALVTAGVPRSRLSMESRGAVPYDLMPTESRRVEIVVGN